MEKDTTKFTGASWAAWLHAGCTRRVFTNLKVAQAPQYSIEAVAKAVVAYTHVQPAPKRVGQAQDCAPTTAVPGCCCFCC